MSRPIQITPRVLWNFKPEVLGSVRGERGFDRRFPGEGLTGGEGRGVWELHGFKAHHWVVLGCGERLGGGGSTEQAGEKRSSTAARVIRWSRVEDKGLGSCAGSRRT